MGCAGWVHLLTCVARVRCAGLDRQSELPDSTGLVLLPCREWERVIPIARFSGIYVPNLIAFAAGPEWVRRAGVSTRCYNGHDNPFDPVWPLAHRLFLTMTRPQFLLLLLVAAALLALPSAGRDRRPNVLVFITDDQGYGDLGLHGNEKIRTPHLDQLGRESVQFTQFCVNPVCAPTRASLMTGRYSYRTRVVDTFLGRALMDPAEVTLAEVFRDAGYRTGIFGKWHLGDNYPLRALDQGFQEALVCTGGGLTQPSDPPGNHYQDPVLLENGRAQSFEGYCTELFTDAALRFISRNRRRPFFAYVPYNAPHTPLEVDDTRVAPYRAAGLDEVTAKVYAMVTQVDENVGRVLGRVRELGLERDTIVVFLTDNGPQQRRYVAGFRGLKGAVYEGGIHVPCFVRWTGTLSPAKVDRMAAHLDLFPTLLDACRVPPPVGVKLDGRSLLPLLRGGNPTWPDRTLFFQWHRGDRPEPFRSAAARTARWKLVNGQELYDLAADPGEARDVAATHPEVVARLRGEYRAWYREVSAERGYDPPRIHLGSRRENPVTLTRQDWRGPRAGWAADSLGHWEVEVERAARYRITFRFGVANVQREAVVRLGGIEERRDVPAGAERYTLRNVILPRGPARLEAWLATGTATAGVEYVEVGRNE